MLFIEELRTTKNPLPERVLQNRDKYGREDRITFGLSASVILKGGA